VSRPPIAADPAGAGWPDLAAVARLRLRVAIVTGAFRLHEADATAIVDAIEARRLTAEQVTRAYLARIAAFDKAGPSINAIIAINRNAVEDARTLDASFRSGGITGPLHGVPVVLKDNFEAAGTATTAGSLALQEHRPPHDAFVVRKLRAAGAVILAKANLHEFALGGTTTSSLGGQTRNPYDLARTPGGSSGGPGAAVAANFCAVGMGSDTVNSIRSPASAQNLVGLRPTRGLLSRSGVVPVSPTQDVVGPIVRSVRDAARMLDAMAGYDPEDPATTESLVAPHGHYLRSLNDRALRGLRIGICTCLFGSESRHAEVNEVVMRALHMMEAAGAKLVEMRHLALDVPVLVDELDVQKHEFKDAVNDYLFRSHAPVGSLGELVASEKFHPRVGAFLRDAEAFDFPRHAAAYRQRQAGMTRLRNRVLAALTEENVDVLAYPLQRQLAAPIDDLAQQPERNGIVASLCGFPAIDVPAGFSRATPAAPLGVPIGMDLLGPPWSDQLLLNVAFAFERRSTFRTPPLCAPEL
jgi:amidase